MTQLAHQSRLHHHHQNNGTQRRGHAQSSHIRAWKSNIGCLRSVHVTGRGEGDMANGECGIVRRPGPKNKHVTKLCFCRQHLLQRVIPIRFGSSYCLLDYNVLIPKTFLRQHSSIDNTPPLQRPSSSAMYPQYPSVCTIHFSI